MVDFIFIYISLFLSCFLSATILPGQSEIVLTALIMSGNYSLIFLIFIASVGNILGSIVNWFLGIKIKKIIHKIWFPASESQLKKATNWYRKYGSWSLLLSWVPFIGDPLTIVAGICKMRFLLFLLIVTIAKTFRYIFISLIICQSFLMVVNDF